MSVNTKAIKNEETPEDVADSVKSKNSIYNSEETATAKNKPKKQKTLTDLIASVGIGILLAVVIVVAIIMLTRQKRYDDAYSSIARITVDGDFIEECYDDMDSLFETMDMYGNYCFCDGTINVPAEIDENGMFKNKELPLSVGDNVSLYKIKNFGDPYGDELNGHYLLEEIKIEEGDYAKLATSQYYDLIPQKMFISIPEVGFSEILNLKIVYSLSDDDRAIFGRLEQQRKDRIAEEERIKAEEKARQEEEKRAKAEAEAAEKAAQQAWAELTYDKYANKIKVGMTRDQLQEIFDFRGKCRHTSDAGNSVFYDCSGNGGTYSSATFQFNFKTGKLVYKSQYGLR